MLTAEQYLESLRRLNLKVYLFGQLVESPVDHPVIRPSINSVAKTYELVADSRYEDLMTVVSSLTGSLGRRK